MTRMPERASLVGAIVMTLALLWVSVVPGAGLVFAYGGMHYVSHFAAFAVLAFAWRYALPNAPAWAVLAAVAAFGFVQEAIEIAGHAHGFELADALVDAAGALAGVALASLARVRSAGEQR